MNIRAVEYFKKNVTIFLRRHYPYQVKGFDYSHLSAWHP